MYKQLKSLFKMGIVVFVLISAVAGYALGFPVESDFSILHFILFLMGTFLISSGSLAFNQVQEVGRDEKMDRTKERPIVSGYMSKNTALSISLFNMISGSIVLYILAPITCYVGLVIIFLYNGLYTLHWKPNWLFAAVPGAVPGALPGVLGFSVVNPNIFSRESVYLFLVMFLWQMPHFWTLAIRYRDDYAKGGFPILPVVVGKERTIYHISYYVFAYGLLAIMSPFFVPFHGFYFLTVLPFVIIVTYQFFKYSKATEEKAWLPFFLWTNFSLLIYMYAPVLDRALIFYLNIYQYR